MVSPFTLFSSNEVGASNFTVCAMFTESYRAKAERLISSLKSLSIDFKIYQVAAIHSSISVFGKSDLELSKPNFIRHALGQTTKSVLYVDADMVFLNEPLEFVSLERDFAIFNWLSSDATDAWVPLEDDSQRRFWRFSHSNDDWSDTQLICSGCVQWWSQSNLARKLLDRWQKEVGRNPQTQDDHSLDIAFNLNPDNALRAHWLTKEYARYAFWIFTKPIIDHPDLPTTFSNSPHSSPKNRILPSQVLLDVGKAVPVARGLMIDAENRTVLARTVDGKYVPWAPLKREMFLPPHGTADCKSSSC
jgi:hypothetical protein